VEVVSARHCLLVLGLATVAFGQEHWVATWGTSQQVYRNPPRAAAQNTNAAPQFTAPDNQTIRMIVHASIGGSRVRIELTNPFAGEPVKVGTAHIAIRDKEGSITAATDRTITVSGQKSFTMPAGATVVSDPVDLTFAPLTDLAVSLYFPGKVTAAGLHTLGLHTTYISGPGDFTGATRFEASATRPAYFWLSTIDVLAPANAGAIVVLGDSITDGYNSTPDANRMWPAALAARLQKDSATSSIAVVNEGISGNRVLSDGSGVAVLARFDHDVLSVPGVKWILYLEGINDIGGEARSETGLTVDDLTAAARQMIAKAHERGIRMIGCTLTPYQGAAYYSDKFEPIRAAYNDWVRKSRAFDAVIDFDAATRDQANPIRFREDVQSGDWLHPNDAGYQVMADTIDLKLFR
jgi:lysophospholipase L1-like esterase